MEQNHTLDITLMDKHRAATAGSRSSSPLPSPCGSSQMGKTADLALALKLQEEPSAASGAQLREEHSTADPLAVRRRSIDGVVSDVSPSSPLQCQEAADGLPPPLPKRPSSGSSTSAYGQTDNLWYYASGVESGKPGAQNGVQGPADILELQQLWREAAIDERTLMWKQGMLTWESLNQLPTLFEEVCVPPALPIEESELQRQQTQILFLNGVEHKPTPVEVLTITRCCSVCGALAAFQCRGCGGRGLHGVGESANKSYGTGFGASEIIPSFLWIGNLRATHQRALEALKFTHVLNATADIPDVTWENEQLKDLVKDIAHLRIPLREGIGIYDYLEEAYNFVELARCNADGQKYSKTGNRVLIHSEQGNHRSAHLAIGYLIRRDGLLYKEAVEYVKSKRETIEMQPRATEDLERWSDEHSIGRLYCHDCLKDVHEYHGDGRLEDAQIGGMAKRMEEEAPTLTVVDHRGQGLTCEEATVLSHALRLNSMVHTLILDGCSMGDQGIAILAQAMEHTPQLAYLGLSYNHLTVTGLVSLMSALEMCEDNHVCSLDLSYNAISEDGGRHLGSYLEKLTNLTALNVANNQLGDEGVYQILERLGPQPFQNAGDLLQREALRRQNSGRSRRSRGSAKSRKTESLEDAKDEVNESTTNKNGDPTQSSHNESANKQRSPKKRSEILSAARSLGTFGAATEEEETFNGTLTSLNISCNNAGQKSGNRLAEIVKHNGVLFSLTANFNPGMGKSEMKSMANNFRLYNNTLQHLSLCQNELGDDGAAAFARNLGMASDQGCQLQALHLAENSILSMGANRISAGLVQNTTLTHLELSNNVIRTKGANHLARALEENKTLKRLEVSACGIDHEGIVCIAFSLLKNKTLEDLNLSENEVGKEGSKALSNALLTNTTLSALDLSNCQVGMAGAEFFAKAFRQNKTLKQIMLRGNQIRDPGAKALARSITSNYTLSKMDLAFNFITNVGVESFKVALQTPSSSAIEKKVFNLDIDFTGNAIDENQPHLSRSKQRISFSTTNRFDVSHWSKQIQAP